MRCSSSKWFARWILCTSLSWRHGTAAGTEIGSKKLVQIQRGVQGQVYRCVLGQRQWLVEGASAQKLQNTDARFHRLGGIVPPLYVQQQAQPPHRQAVDLSAKLIERQVLERLIGEILYGVWRRLSAFADAHRGNQGLTLDRQTSGPLGRHTAIGKTQTLRSVGERNHAPNAGRDFHPLAEPGGNKKRGKVHILEMQRPSRCRTGGEGEILRVKADASGRDICRYCLQLDLGGR